MYFPFAILLLFSLGALELNFPNALSLSTFNDNYTGTGWAGLIVLVFELILAATWGKISGIILIAAGIFLLGIWVMDYRQNKSKLVIDSNDNETDNASIALSAKKLAVKSAILGYRKYKNRNKNAAE